MLSEDVQAKLESCDWDELGKLLTLHGFHKLSGSVIGGSRPSREFCLEKAEDIALDATKKLLAGDRRWNPETDPNLLEYLRDVVDSLISHFLNGSPNRLERPFPEDGVDPAFFPSPDSNLIYDDLLASVVDEPELAAVLAAMADGHVTGGELAEALGISVAEVVNRRKRLRRRVRERGYAPETEVLT